MSSHCNRYPGCGCGSYVGTKCQLPEGDLRLLEKEADGKPWEEVKNEFDIEAEKRRIAEYYDRLERGGSSIRPKRKHATNYTPPKKKRK